MFITSENSIQCREEASALHCQLLMHSIALLRVNQNLHWRSQSYLIKALEKLLAPLALLAHIC